MRSKAADGLATPVKVGDILDGSLPANKMKLVQAGEATVLDGALKVK